jgi:hypothetical protein
VQGVAPGTAPAVAPGVVRPGVVVPRVPIPPQVVSPPQGVVQPPVVVPQETVVPVPMTPVAPEQPLIDEGIEDLPVIEEQNGEFVDTRRGVKPYGGGSPADWSWGCNGSPYRTEGMCDDWRVGCRWHITVDGIVLSREDTSLAALQGFMPNYFQTATFDGVPNDGIMGTPTLEQFEEEGGARITFTSQVAKYTGWDVQFAYEGVPEWNASIVFPAQLETLDYPLDPNLPPPYPDPVPPAPFPEAFLQRSLHYRTALHSGELNALPGKSKSWRPIFGFRYFSFDDEINDTLSQEAQPPLPGPADAVDVGGGGVLPVDPEFQPLGPAVTTDRVNIFDIQNNLMGFQFGLMHDTWQVNRRFSVEGIMNAGVYYNRIKYTNYQGIFTTQVYADNTNSDGTDEARIDFSDVVNNDVREYSEIAYHAEASVTGVCRLNRCWALRGGYQVLWIDNVHVAEDAYLGAENVNRDLLFHGWHAGIECRR